MSTIDRSHYPGIPADFPVDFAVEAHAFAPTGVQAPLQPGQEEVQDDYEAMLELSRQQMAVLSALQLPDADALEIAIARESQMLKSYYGIWPAHVDWVMNRVRLLLKEAGHPAALQTPGTSTHQDDKEQSQ